jgi:hypothetical protein
MDIRNYLRELDREEEDIRAQIMRLQVRIQQLNDTRIVLMQREEEKASRSGHMSPFGSLHGGEIVVRDRDKMLPPEPKAAALEAPKQRGGQLGVTKPNQNKLAPAILAVIKSQGGVATSKEICDQLEDQFERRLLTKALYNGVVRGTFRKEGDIYRAGPKKLASRGSGGGEHNPALIAEERRLVLDVLGAADRPLTSGEIIGTILNGAVDKRRRDRLFHQIQRLTGRGEVVKTGKEYKLLALKQPVPEEDAA